MVLLLLVVWVGKFYILLSFIVEFVVVIINLNWEVNWFLELFVIFVINELCLFVYDCRCKNKIIYDKIIINFVSMVSKLV